MIKYFVVSVDHMMTTVEEQTTPLKRVDYKCRTDGIALEYMIVKTPKGQVKNWFERGVTQLQQHAKNFSKSGVVLWDKRASRVYKPSKKMTEIMAKMEKLL